MIRTRHDVTPEQVAQTVFGYLPMADKRAHRAGQDGDSIFETGTVVHWFRMDIWGELILNLPLMSAANEGEGIKTDYQFLPSPCHSRQLVARISSNPVPSGSLQ
jgi:hypothetical protein